MTRGGWKPPTDSEIEPTIVEIPDEIVRQIQGRRGVLTESAGSEYRFTLVAAPRGIHAWLCRIGVHAWELRRRWMGADRQSGMNQRRCAVCRRWETR